MNTRQKHLVAAFFAIATLGAFHAFFHAYGLYDTTTWVDVVTHFLGGVVVGFGALWLFGLLGVGWRGSVLAVLIAVLVVGGVWEVFEYIAEFPQEAQYVLDTVGDLVADVLGALFAWELSHKNMLV